MKKLDSLFQEFIKDKRLVNLTCKSGEDCIKLSYVDYADEDIIILYVVANKNLVIIPRNEIMQLSVRPKGTDSHEDDNQGEMIEEGLKAIIDKKLFS